jgi:hypothetical protein
VAGEQLPVRTAAYGVSLTESYWLDMFKNMIETLSVGVVISDMTIPGIPLVAINEGTANLRFYLISELYYSLT